MWTTLPIWAVPPTSAKMVKSTVEFSRPAVPLDDIVEMSWAVEASNKHYVD